MGDFRKNGGKRFGGHGGGFGGRDGGRGGFDSGRRDRGPVTMHQAVCDQCGKPCEVPFKPFGDKPVYCNTCFGSKAGNDRGRDRFPRKSFDGYKAPMKPDFGSDMKRGNADELKQLELLNEKMDRLIATVEAVITVQSRASKEVAVQAVATSKAKKSAKKVSKRQS